MSVLADAPTANGCISTVPAIIEIHLEVSLRRHLDVSPERTEHVMSVALQERSAPVNALLAQAVARTTSHAHSMTRSLEVR